VRENVGHTLDTVMTRRQEPRQAIMHHGPADEVDFILKNPTKI